MIFPSEHQKNDNGGISDGSEYTDCYVTDEFFLLQNASFAIALTGAVEIFSLISEKDKALAFSKW